MRQVRSESVLQHLEGWGFSPDVQCRIGAFAVVWGVFEASLESALWALNDEQVKGKRPTTDKSMVSSWISEWSSAAHKFDQRLGVVVEVAASAAESLLSYRHALFHGWMIPSATMPSFIRNPSWNGESRKRPMSEAHVNSELLDMAIATSWTLCRVVDISRKATESKADEASFEELLPQVREARSFANELANLSALMNHEKY